MTQQLRSRNRVDKPLRQRRRRQPRYARRNANAQSDVGSWVVSPLLSAMDNMERHVQEMLNYDRQPLHGLPRSSKHKLESEELKELIVREVKRRVEERLNDIVDTAIIARVRRPEASQTAGQSSIDELQTARKRDSQTLKELDALHRHEYTLNTALVERLFNAPSLEGHPDTRFGDTTFGLQDTDIMSSVLVSHVEVLVMNVQKLERVVKWLQAA
ncbi:hypothetical protein E8E12_003667 [Didymella heteroderae]|uniref:Uncharacterized protein n=1 Tax=Didymella heteroderae TaxID=1769908 RepID=A0A9P4WIE8_9PLEO|nr:hypothetical protein E8E12_003667 [Didymella heteroderae]